MFISVLFLNCSPSSQNLDRFAGGDCESFTLSTNIQTIELPPNGRATVEIGISRGAGFDSPVLLSITNTENSGINSPIQNTGFTPNPIPNEIVNSTLSFEVIPEVSPGEEYLIEIEGEGTSTSLGLKCKAQIRLVIVAEETAFCDSFNLQISPANNTLLEGGSGEVSIVSTRTTGFNDEVDLSLELEAIDDTPTEVVGQNLVAQNILADFNFNPQVLNNEFTGSFLNYTLGSAFVPNAVYTFKIVGTSTNSGEELCSKTFILNAASCPTEECPDGSFYVVGELCVLEEDAIASGNLLQNPGFETDAFGENFPTDAVGWSGDGVTQVSEENGITPPQGNHMLRFDAADVTGSSGLAGSEIAQIYVLPDDLKNRINGGETITVRQEAFFNRVEGDANTDTEFLVLIIAFDGPTTDFPQDYLNRDTLDLERASATLSSDACTNTWEKLGAQIEIPMGTNYIGVVLVAAENIENDTTGPEFDGHYVDAASLIVE